MQDKATLLSVGFKLNGAGEWFYRGVNQIFVAKEVDYNGPYVFIELFLVSDTIDTRPHSENKGKRYRSFLKSCCSEGSVERSIKKYDVKALNDFTG